MNGKKNFAEEYEIVEATTTCDINEAIRAASQHAGNVRSARREASRFCPVGGLVVRKNGNGTFQVKGGDYHSVTVAATRAGKTRRVIVPMLDSIILSDESNLVVNDPKGELLVKNYVPATVRGYQPVQFNLINAMKTDIYNPLAMAAQAAREGDSTKCAQFIENIAEVFFPLDGGEDPVWPNAANNAFKRAAYGMIDYYLEEEKELRLIASQTGMDDKVLERKIDELWGKVTFLRLVQLPKMFPHNSSTPSNIVISSRSLSHQNRLSLIFFTPPDIVRCLIPLYLNASLSISST
jgi:type IV secretory pathway TraG/TraD family ATPase VirD4